MFGVLLLLVIIGGVGYKLVAPSSAVKVANGGKYTQIFTDKPEVPLGGCSVWRVGAKLFWQKERKPEAK